MLLGDEVEILRPPGEQLVASLVNKKISLLICCNCIENVIDRNGWLFFRGLGTVKTR